MSKNKVYNDERFDGLKSLICDDYCKFSASFKNQDDLDFECDHCEIMAYIETFIENENLTRL